MSRRLESAAEVLKLNRLLDIDEEHLTGLVDLPADELRELREKVTDSLFDTGASALHRVALGAKLLPSPVVASIAQRAFGPLLCARAAAAVDPAKAIDVAGRLPAGFLADVTVELDPRRVADIISRVSEDLVVPVAAELGRRREFVTMGRFLAYVPDRAIVAAMTALDDEALLRTAFVLEHKDRLDHALGLLPPERLPGILAHASEHYLWPEALDLLEHLSEARRGPVADVLAEQDDRTVASLVTSVAEAGIWESLLPVVGTMSPDHRRLLAAKPAFHEPTVLGDIVRAAAQTGLWLDLLPLLSELPPHAIALLPPIVADLETDSLVAMISEAAASADVLVGMVDILDLLDETTTARIVEVIDSADRVLGEALLSALTDPAHVRLLLERLPADILTAVERAADRLGMRAEYDTAVAASGAAVDG
jgi:hypothetical protein